MGTRTRRRAGGLADVHPALLLACVQLSQGARACSNLLLQAVWCSLRVKSFSYPSDERQKVKEEPPSLLADQIEEVDAASKSINRQEDKLTI